MTAFDPTESPTRAAALARLSGFLPNSGRHYAARRNTDYGPADRSNVSMLSPFIRHRLLLESEVLDTVLARYAPSTAEKFIQEVFWRSYFKGWLEQRPSVWGAYRSDLAKLIAELKDGGQLARRYSQAVGGRTGIDCFDTWAVELIETGYLHNHSRMWFASIWVFTLQLPWQLGADFFYRHLLDGDPASNTLSWRWVAGLHTKGKTYQARPDNIQKYTNGRFAPFGELATSAPPLEEMLVHERRPIPEAADARDDTPAILLITEEDCTLETLCPRDRVRGGVACLVTADRSPLEVGARARRFASGAVRDATERAEAYFGCAIASCSEEADWARAIKEACRQSGATKVLTAYAPVGPVSERLAVCRAELENEGIQILSIRRDFDDLTWPHATRGFFALKAKIPGILGALDQNTKGVLKSSR